MTANSVLRPFLILALLIPVAGSAAAESFEYNSHGRRDPFTPLIGSDRPSIARLADVTSVEEMNLEGVAVGAKGEMVAMVNGEMVKANDRIGDITVKSITKSGVTLTVGGKEYQLKLSEEGGKNGG